MSFLDKQNEIPEHLSLAAQWSIKSITDAQSTMLSDIEKRINQVDEKISEHQNTVNGIERQYETVKAIRQSEITGIGPTVDKTCRQIDRLGLLMDAVEKNLGELESAMDKAEAAVGLSIGGRLEQLAKMLGSSVSGNGSSAGVPYLRQWASKERAVPKVVSTKEYLDGI